MNTELRKIVGRVKQAQSKIRKAMEDRDWLEEARKYAERQGSEVKRLFSSDTHKVEAFLERQKKELERIQKRIPGEVKKYRALLQNQSKELEKILGKLVAGKKKKSVKKSRSKSSSASGSKSKKKNGQAAATTSA